MTTNVGGGLLSRVFNVKKEEKDAQDRGQKRKRARKRDFIYEL